MFKRKQHSEESHKHAEKRQCFQAMIENQNVCAKTKSEKNLTLLLDEPDIVCAVSHMRGRRSNMEDSHINASIEKTIGDPAKKLVFLRVLAVCDGHGGKQCSQFLKKNLALEVARLLCNVEPDDSNTVNAAIIDAFKNVEKNWEKTENDGSGSTCCLMAYYPQHNLFYVANCGDSRAIGFSDLDEIANGKQITIDHNPSLPSENRRIVEAGGFVTKTQFGKNEFIHRVNGAISVSRSFGDVSLRPYITEIPDVFGPFGTKENKAVLLACDGAFEVNSTKQLCDELSEVVKQNESTSTTRNRSSQSYRALQIANRVTKYCYEKGSGDNITALFIDFSE